MKHDKRRVNINLNLEMESAKRLDLFLEKTGRGITPFVRMLVMREVEAWEGSSNDQASDLRKMMEGEA